jgi:hypothetical protein
MGFCGRFVAGQSDAMTGIGNTTRLLQRVSRSASRALLAVLACGLLGVIGHAVAQQPQPQPPPPQQQQPPVDQTAPTVMPPAPAVPSYAFQPGFIDAVGRWLGNSKTTLDQQLRGTQETIGDIGLQASDAVKDAAGAAKEVAGAAKQATGAIADLPNTRVVNGRQRCPLAANGAPDCSPAAVALCKGRGFAGGRGLDIDSAQKCPAWVWLSGRSPQRGECHTETFVTRAVCQ